MTKPITPQKIPGCGTQLKLSDEAWQLLLDYSWPGNVRELFGVVERAAHMTSDNEISPENLPESLRTPVECERRDLIPVPLVGDLREIERHIIRTVIERCDGNKAAAARALGLHRRTLYRMLDVQSTERNGEPESAHAAPHIATAQDSERGQAQNLGALCP